MPDEMDHLRDGPTRIKGTATQKSRQEGRENLQTPNEEGYHLTGKGIPLQGRGLFMKVIRKQNLSYEKTAEREKRW